MDQKEIDFIANDLYQRELEFRKDPKNAYDVQVEQEFFQELNTLGYNFHWNGQFDASIFSKKNKAIIPIFLKHLDRFKNANMRINYLGCLGVKGFYDATEFLIAEYKKYIPPTYNSGNLNVVSQTIAQIQDPRFIETYLGFLNDNVLVTDTWHIIKMLGIMKVEEAIPHLIRLLDGARLLDNYYYGTTIEKGKFLVSQTAIETLSAFKNPKHVEYIKKFLEPEKLSWITFTESKEKHYNLKETYKQYKKIAEKAIKMMSR